MPKIKTPQQECSVLTLSEKAQRSAAQALYRRPGDHGTLGGSLLNLQGAALLFGVRRAAPAILSLFQRVGRGQ